MQVAQRDIGGAAVEQAGCLCFLATDDDAPLRHLGHVAARDMQVPRQDQRQATRLGSCGLGDAVIELGKPTLAKVAGAAEGHGGEPCGDLPVGVLERHADSLAIRLPLLAGKRADELHATFIQQRAGQVNPQRAVVIAADDDDL